MHFIICLLVCYKDHLSYINLLELEFDLGHDRVYYHQSFCSWNILQPFTTNLINVELKVKATNLWQSLSPVSRIKVFWKAFGLLVSNASKRVPLLNLRDYMYPSDKKNDFFHHALFKHCNYIVVILFTIWLELPDISSKKKKSFVLGTYMRTIFSWK